MLPEFTYLRPTSLDEAVATLRGSAGELGATRLLAGGQSLLAAMKLGLTQPRALVDLQGIPALQTIAVVGGDLHLGAMCTHAQIAESAMVRAFCPMLCELAGGIGDAQIRARGTVGGSLANNDPAACWPAGLLALDARVVTTQRTLGIGDFLQGLYTTALRTDEVVVRVECPASSRVQPGGGGARYIKFEQLASRFALVGVAVWVGVGAGGKAETIRIALTGLGLGACRWIEGEGSMGALPAYPEALATSDLHASSRYRAHLVGVLTRRALAGLVRTGATHVDGASIGASVAASVSVSVPASVTSPSLQTSAIRGETRLPLERVAVWRGLLDPAVLARSIPGCESFEADGLHAYRATVKFGVGLVSARIAARVTLRDLVEAQSLTMVFEGSAGPMGDVRGEAQLVLAQASPQSTQLAWQATPVLGGKLAMLGGRMLEGLARSQSEAFFARFQTALTPPEIPVAATVERTATPAIAPTAAHVPHQSPTAAPSFFDRFVRFIKRIWP